MRTRHAIAASMMGLSLTAVSVAMPSPASAATAAPCADLLSCVVSTVATTTGTVTTTVGSTLGSVVTPVVASGAVPTVLNTVLPTKKPSQPTTPPKTTHKPHKMSPGRAKHTVTRAVTTKPVTARPAAHQPPVKHVAPAATPQTAPQPPTIGPEQSPIVDVIQTVGSAVQSVVNLFGWNLLALVPMGLIAVGISRRMGSRRRSISGLL